MTTTAITGDEVLAALLVLGPACPHRGARDTVYLWCFAVANSKAEYERAYWQEAAEHVVGWLELHGPVKLRVNSAAGAAGYLRTALLHAKTTAWRTANKTVAQNLAAARRLDRLAAKQGVQTPRTADRKNRATFQGKASQHPL